MSAPIDPAQISDDLRSVLQFDLEALRLEWRRRWKEQPPKYRSRDLLHRALTHKIQAEAYGDVSPALRRRIHELARKFAADRSYSPTPGPNLKPGCSLIREWHGARHEVVVMQDAYRYEDQVFRSLSQVAQHITGTKWNGHAFFGLKKRDG